MITVAVLFATMLCVAIPIKIWNSARIEHKLQEQEQLLLAARIDSLANQINPHFLFNTLNSIGSLIRSQPETARVLIVKLSGLLRRLLKSQDHFVTLREELSAIDEYLDIECVRFGPRLRVVKDIAPDCLDSVVPSMLLQPLVENSLKHGLARKRGVGTLVLKSYRQDRHTVVEIVDDGIGIEPDEATSRPRRGHRPAKRQRAAPRRLRRELLRRAAVDARRGDAGARHDSRPGAAGAGDRMSEAPLRVLVVDDEPLAREELCFLLAELGGIEVVGQAADGVEAARMAEDLEPEMVFLDVQMPGVGGFEVARRLVLGPDPPEVVFVTAFDQYALDAFAVNAVDYLLKPVDSDSAGAGRPTGAKAGHGAGRAASESAPLTNEALEQIVQMVAERQTRRERLAVKVGERLLLVAADEVIYASVVDDTIAVVTGQVAGTSNFRTLDELHAHLDPAVFWRVHRSHVVNINKIKEIVPWFSRNYILRMKDPKATEIPVSRSQTKRLRDYLKL